MTRPGGAAPAPLVLPFFAAPPAPGHGHDPVARWTASPDSPGLTHYEVAWTRGGAAAGAAIVPRGGASDAAGYSSAWSAANPTVAPKPGDVVGASVAAVDAAGNMRSPAVAASPVTIPAAPPNPPGDVTLGLG